MVYHELEPSNLTIAAKLLSHVKRANSRYFIDQKKHTMQIAQSGRDVKMKQVNDDVTDANRGIKQLQDMTNYLKTSGYEYSFEADEKSIFEEIRNLIFKINALKCADTEKQNLLDSFVKKRLC